MTGCDACKRSAITGSVRAPQSLQIWHSMQHDKATFNDHNLARDAPLQLHAIDEYAWDAQLAGWS